MISVAITIAVCSLFIEIQVLRRVPALKAAVIGSTLINLIFSLFISFCLGAVFEAKGVTVMLAAMLATTASIPLYRALSLNSRRKEISDGIYQGIRSRARRISRHR